MNDEKHWIVETRDLTRIYGDGSEIRALDGVDLYIAPGELVAVMGPSGSGKSTLLNMIGALDRPTRGQVFVDGQDLAKIRNKDRFRGRTVGFVFQLHNLLPTLSSLENVEVPMMGQVGSRARRKRAKELLELVGLPDRMNHLPNQLSGGQRQRVSIARSLIHDPSLVLADEPTASLDTERAFQAVQIFSDLIHEQNKAGIMVTHDLRMARYVDKVIQMMDGSIANVIEDPIAIAALGNAGQEEHSQIAIPVAPVELPTASLPIFIGRASLPAVGD
jgi:ABC-type lipoprotein export system ATPase subunit